MGITNTQKFERPVSPGHSLKLLNETMRRTSLLRLVHKHLQELKEAGSKRSPLEMLIDSLRYALKAGQSDSVILRLTRNPFHTEPDSYRPDLQTDFLHDAQLIEFHCNCHLEALRDIHRFNEDLEEESEECELSATQIAFAERIDRHVCNIVEQEGGDEMLMRSLYDYSADFKTLMDISTAKQMNELAIRYPGFYRYARLIETIAKGIASGERAVPKDH